MSTEEKQSPDSNKISPDQLTPSILASAIKLALLSEDNQQKLSTETVNDAIKLAEKNENEEESASLTPETLAAALKLVMNKPDQTDEIHTLARTSAAMSQLKDILTANFVDEAVRLSKE